MNGILYFQHSRKNLPATVMTNGSTYIMKYAQPSHSRLPLVSTSDALSLPPKSHRHAQWVAIIAIGVHLLNHWKNLSMRLL